MPLLAITGVLHGIASVLLGLGAIFMLIAAVGLLRMPDLLMRMQAATKAPALGAGLIFLAALTYFWQAEVTARTLAAIVFIFITLPLAAHILSRAAYLSGTQIWQGTRTGLPESHDEERRRGDAEADLRDESGRS